MRHLRPFAALAAALFATAVAAAPASAKLGPSDCDSPSSAAVFAPWFDGTDYLALDTGGGPLALRCFQPTVKGANVGTMKAVDCAKSHDAEFAGLWTAPDMKFEDLGGTRMAQGCRSVIADWAKVPDNGDVLYRYGYLGFAPTRPEWDNGVRSVQCFLWIDGRKMTGAYRNAGPGKLPINYG